MWQSIDELSTLALDFVVAKYGVHRMKHILDVPVGIDRENGKRVFPKKWKKLAVRNLSFSYGEKEVLREVSFEVRRGERIGIVGISGAGKSTLFKLLLKEHEHYRGEILLDDVPLRKIRKSSFFHNAAVVLQDTEVFNFTLRENIIMANPKQGRNEELLRKAIEVAHVTDFLQRLPQGLGTVIGEKGIKLSGGEKQRVGIARAVFKDPQLLFLDEATSHLDLESEEKIRDSLHKFFQSVTAIVIAHRLTTIREMDRIIVIEDGKILEDGSFAQLRARKGRFDELWKKQKL
jgi:ATP-binding cassette subfamily B protein